MYATKSKVCCAYASSLMYAALSHLPSLPSFLSPRGPQVGGQLHLHGMPGGGSTPSWVRLLSTVHAGDRQLQVDGDVSKWPVGGTVVISSTSNNMNDAEQGTITRGEGLWEGLVGGRGGGWAHGLDG